MRRHQIAYSHFLEFTFEKDQKVRLVKNSLTGHAISLLLLNLFYIKKTVLFLTSTPR